ncbi:MAG TPA: hypothetical protein VIG99_12260 [Myxococcaceae bacterium]
MPQGPRPLPLLVACCALLTGCAFGNVREREIGALGPYRDLAVRTIPVGGMPAPGEMNEELQAGLQRGLETWNKVHAPPGPPTPGTVMEVQPEILEINVAGGSAPDPVAAAASQLGLGRAVPANRVSLLLLLRVPGTSDPIGELLWESAGGSLSEMASYAGQGAGDALAKEMLARRDQWVTRRAADERFLLTPSARLLDPGELVLSNDEVLLFHIGVGVTPWLELNLSAGGLPLPAAGAIPIVGHGAGGVGGAGILLLGAVDVGARFRLLEEGPWWPGIAVGYDLLDAFAAALGGAGIFFAGNGIAGVGGAAVAGANVQLNVFTVAASKRVGPFDFNAGAFVFDNHHFLPQSAGFAAGITTGQLATATYSLDRMPTVVVPFAAAQATPWPWLHIIQEIFPRTPVTDTFGSTALRLVVGPFALSPLRLKFDAAVIEAYDSEGPRPGPVFLPWFGAGIYIL